MKKLMHYFDNNINQIIPFSYLIGMLLFFIVGWKMEVILSFVIISAILLAIYALRPTDDYYPRLDNITALILVIKFGYFASEIILMDTDITEQVKFNGILLSLVLLFCYVLYLCFHFYSFFKNQKDGSK